MPYCQITSHPNARDGDFEFFDDNQYFTRRFDDFLAVDKLLLRLQDNNSESMGSGLVASRAGKQLKVEPRFPKLTAR